MRNQPKAIVLGGSHAHIALIENLKERGYYTVLVDYYENPPAKNFADRQIKESTLDKEKVLEITKSLKAEIVINVCLDQPISTVCFVAEELGLMAPYSYKTALNVTDKVMMKEMMVKGGIPTSRYIFVNDEKGIENFGLNFPAVVKPADGTGSLGVRKVDNLLELNSSLKEALMVSRTNKAIVEEFCKGIEVNIYCFIENKIPHLLMMVHKVNNRIEGEFGGEVIQFIGSITPVEISQKAWDHLQQIAHNITTTFDLRNTPLLIQAIIDGDDVNVIEFAARMGGGLSHKNIKLNTGFDILTSTVDAYLGLSVNLARKDSEYCYATNIIYATYGIFDKFSGHEDLVKGDIIEEFFIYKTKGMEIAAGMSSRNRVGAFIVKGKNKEELFKKIRIAINKLNVYDIDGKRIMKKDIFLRPDMV